MAYIGSGLTRFNTADDLTVTDDAEIQGGLTVSTTTLVVDDVNNRVGIGTASPSRQLDIRGTGAQHLNVGSTDGTSAKLTLDASNGDASGGDFHEFIGDSDLEIKARNSSDTANFILTNDGGERMRIDSSGRVTKPYQPCFYAYSDGSQSVSSGDILEFGLTDINVGSHYSTSTNRFTAPIAGKYVFNVHVSVFVPVSGIRFWDARIKKNGSTSNLRSFRDTAHYFVSGQYSSVSGSVVMSLSANDYVELDIQWGGSAGTITSTQSDYCNFSGYLLG